MRVFLAGAAQGDAAAGVLAAAVAALAAAAGESKQKVSLSKIPRQAEEKL
jgi:hypothetical protein